MLCVSRLFHHEAVPQCIPSSLWWNLPSISGACFSFCNLSALAETQQESDSQKEKEKEEIAGAHITALYASIFNKKMR